MSNYQDLIGQKFGKLTVIEYAGKAKDGHSLWKCQCDCGNFCTVCSNNLKSGGTKSCKCYRNKFKSLNAKHNYIEHKRLYKIWCSIKTRCYNNKSRAFNYYGGRGIRICDEWLNSFDIFKNWALSNGYKSNLTIDRINNNCNYEPSNCRWVDRYTQANNKRTNVFITYKNESKTLANWAKELGISPSVLWYRLHKSWDIEKVIKTPLRKDKRRKK